MASRDLDETSWDDMTPTADELVALAREMQTEYWGQAERETAPTVQFALREKGNAMGEFITRVEYKLRGELG